MWITLGDGLYSPFVVILGMVYYWGYRIIVGRVKETNSNSGSLPCTMLLSSFPSIGKPIHNFAYRFDSICKSHLMPRMAPDSTCSQLLEAQGAVGTLCLLPIEQAEPIPSCVVGLMIFNLTIVITIRFCNISI